ncbi:uncharacterized protein B0H18DRAFT_235231 [Fomitopsis serialis]|uniref:uncharacterized protein n=1 Tax=Fomitopsis serialis TaxID=139415 RepID=UPI0020088FBC|nr:uncharacterized protein B0H18DRAFT_235231 [Neoantrodia serialis]KAH9928937.1 hypothetical protein B0H18DRAFT_235231 [Neoantrodia serialis]
MPRTAPCYCVRLLTPSRESDTLLSVKHWKPTFPFAYRNILHCMVCPHDKTASGEGQFWMADLRMTRPLDAGSFQTIQSLVRLASRASFRSNPACRSCVLSGDPEAMRSVRSVKTTLERRVIPYLFHPPRQSAACHDPRSSRCCHESVCKPWLLTRKIVLRLPMNARPMGNHRVCRHYRTPETLATTHPYPSSDRRPVCRISPWS